jgi:uridine kinase
MKLPELVQTILEKEKKHPYIIAFEGMIGSGKSYEAGKLKDQLEGKIILITTDLFISVPRSEWTERIENDDIDLTTWYDLKKIKQALASIKRKENFTITGLYNLSNGEFDDELGVDASDCDYLILEGLLSCHEEFDGLIDLRVFLNVPREVALSRAHERDETVRHLDHEGWLQKKDIFYDHYVPYLESHKNRAHIILEPD